MSDKSSSKSELINFPQPISIWGFPQMAQMAPLVNAGDMGLIPGSERYPGEVNGYPFHYSCPENPTDRGSWQATVYGATESDTTEQLCTYIYIYI